MVFIFFFFFKLCETLFKIVELLCKCYIIHLSLFSLSYGEKISDLFKVGDEFHKKASEDISFQMLSLFLYILFIILN